LKNTIAKLNAIVFCIIGYMTTTNY